MLTKTKKNITFTYNLQHPTLYLYSHLHKIVSETNKQRSAVRVLQVNLQRRLQTGLRYCYSKLLLFFWLLFHSLQSRLRLFKTHKIQRKCRNDTPYPASITTGRQFKIKQEQFLSTLVRILIVRYSLPLTA